MVQSVARLWLRYAGGRQTGHLRPYGDVASVRHDRTAPRAVRSGPLRARTQGADGGGSAPRRRLARPRIALAARALSGTRRCLRACGLAAILFVTGCALPVAQSPASAAGQDTIEIVTSSGVHAFSVELATNEAERALGLMFRKSLPEGHGMLFDFKTDQPVQ